MDLLLERMRRAFRADDQSEEQPGRFFGAVIRILAAAAAYYLATRIAWALTFPDSKVSLFFPPHAVLVCVLLLVAPRHWWAYVLAAAASHFIATQQAHWPPLYALQCEAFDAVKYIATAAGIRLFITSRFHRISLREAVIFVAIAVVIVPAGTAFWGAAFTVSNGYGTHYWVEWRSLAVSNGVTAIVLVPVTMIGVHQLRAKRLAVSTNRLLEAGVLAVGIVAVGYLAFNQEAAGPHTSATLLYAPVPLLVWAALRFGLGGVSVSTLIILVMAIWGTMRGRGPFLTQTPAGNALALQVFMLMMATPLMLLAVAIDDERRSKERLRVSEERMSMAVESAHLALWDWDVANDAVWMTDEGRHFFGFGPAQPLGNASLAGRVHPDDSTVRAGAIQRALETGDPYEAEYRVVLPDGSIRWIAARGRTSPTVDGAPLRLLGVSMDVTRQRQADAESQQQREELAHLSRVASLNAMSGSLAHELSQPLSSILTNAEAGSRYAAQDAPDLGELRAIFADIVSEERRAAAIIDGMRTMLRRGEVVRQPVCVSESVEELLRLMRGDLNARGVTVSNLIASDLRPAMTDRVQLQQVLLNLMVNACDAMASVPRQDRQLTLTSRISPQEVRIGVLDRGVGLPDDIEALFQPFHTTKTHGLGMGLSICRTLVQSLGGTLWAERGAERGAAFYVGLPLALEDGVIETAADRVADAPLVAASETHPSGLAAAKQDSATTAPI